MCIVQFSKYLDILGSLATISICSGMLNTLAPTMLSIPWLSRGVNELLVYYDWVVGGGAGI